MSIDQVSWPLSDLEERELHSAALNKTAQMLSLSMERPPCLIVLRTPNPPILGQARSKRWHRGLPERFSLGWPDAKAGVKVHKGALSLGACH